ncbi:MAG: hypothetical protein HOW73_09930 [Polyangiaceae bacterium]|nr:hypothetical protein [Polyangiaceae bacterium]
MNVPGGSIVAPTVVVIVPMLSGRRSRLAVPVMHVDISVGRLDVAVRMNRATREGQTDNQQQ